jgi:hypothetical protein
MPRAAPLNIAGSALRFAVPGFGFAGGLLYLYLAYLKSHLLAILLFASTSTALSALLSHVTSLNRH